MRRLSTAVIAGLLLIGLIAAPASAETPLRGTIDQVLVGEGCTFAGPITFGDHTYGMAFFNAGAPKVVGNSYHFSETWKIYDETFAGCPTDEDVVASGYDWGVVNLQNLKGVGNGEVEDVNPGNDPHGLFTESMIGSNVHWNGFNSFVGVDMLFDATFRINS
jgi:hypothetical protein